jgi:sensor c-di-GMP phosphodiesterase-like protein
MTWWRPSTISPPRQLDDFGTGHSTLSRIRDFPVDIVKIDRSFVCRLTEDNRTRSLARSIIGMVQALELAEFGPTRGRGWLFGKPQPAADIVILLQHLIPVSTTAT